MTMRTSGEMVTGTGQRASIAGRAPTQTLFDTREYENEFADGTRDKYQANVITDNMFAQVDSEGNQFLLLQEITDHKKDHSVGSSCPTHVRRTIHRRRTISSNNDQRERFESAIKSDVVKRNCLSLRPSLSLSLCWNNLVRQP
jgi:bifunctional pyridoxal-dependent enzyme with beta-cystathionase and maltose regulon repressor activities